MSASCPRHIAALTGNLEIMEILASYISDLNAPCKLHMTCQTPLLTAIIYNQTEMARFLVPFCENPNLPDQYGWTSLQVAVANGRTEIVRILAPLSENPNSIMKSGWTPLESATKDEYYEIVSILSKFE